jgi:hypothetical protein
MLAGNDLPKPVGWTAGHQYTFESPEQENACNAQVTFSIEGTELVADLTALVGCAGLEQVVLIDAKADYACTESLNSNAYLTIDFSVEPPKLATACESSPIAPIMFQQLEPYPGPQRFSSVAGGAVADATTGLVWEQRADGLYGSFSEADAEAHCEQLDHAGFSDWRLPNPYELFSLVNLRAHLPGPLIDLSVFPNTPAITFWAKGAWVPADGAGWTIDFGASDPGYMFAGGADLGDSNAARCVRAGKSAAPRFAIDADGTVADNLNDLTWQRGAGTSLTPDQAQAYCRSLNLAGGGWRVPTILELASLADYTKQDPAIDSTVFTSTQGAQWSTTPFFDVDHSGWAIDFYDGSAVGGGDSSDSPLNVRCVR